MENVIIIGGGPAGLAASLYLARANLNPLVFAGSPPGGQLMLTSDVENYPGFESILGPDLIEKYRTHVKKFGTRIIDQNITKVDFKQSRFTVSTVDKSYSAKSIVITTGAKALWLNLPNEQRLRGKGVSACATCDGFFFKDKIVTVVGGGDTAMEETLTLTKFANKVYLIHRRDQFRASKIMQNRVMKNPKVEILWNTEVVDVLGENKVEGLLLRSSKLGKGKETSKEVGSGKLEEKNTNFQTSPPNQLPNPNQISTSELQVDGLFLAIGHKPDTDIFAGQVELDSKGYIYTSARVALENIKYQRLNIKNTNQKSNIFNSEKYDFECQSGTSVKGVFAAGDCADYIYRQAGTAVGMGIEAALDVEKWLEVEI